MKKPNTLVLNKSWFPVNIINWERTMTLLSQDIVTALDREMSPYNFMEWIEFSDLIDDYPTVKTTSRDIAIPEIVILSQFNKVPKIKYRYTRDRLFKRDNYTCGFCNNKFKRSELTIDHIHPKSKGGETSWTNTITACRKCNWKKGNKTIDESGIKIHFNPSVPHWTSPLQHYEYTSILNSWKSFMKV